MTWKATWKAPPSVGVKLFQWRSERHLTRAELGAYLGVSETAVRYWETGKRPIQHETMLRKALAHYECEKKLPARVVDDASRIEDVAQPDGRQPGKRGKTDHGDARFVVALGNRQT